MNYDEFVKWAGEELCDAVIRGGFKELRVTLRYVVLNTLCMNIKTIMPQFFKDQP